MRLIDADEFRYDISRQVEFLQVDDFQVVPVVDVAECLDNAPTVIAIPVEWIKKWCNKEHNRKSLEERLLKRYGVITMLEDWEKENEQ